MNKDDKKSIAELVQEELDKENIEFIKFSDAEEALKYISNNKNFKKTSELLMDLMNKTNTANDSFTYYDYVETLTLLLEKQSKDCNTEKYSKKTIINWFNDEATYFKSRKTPIEICFALKADYVTTKDFMNKCGYNILNVRDAEDAIFIYCIVNNRPLSVAYELIDKYQNILKVDTRITSEDLIEGSGYTSTLLENKLSDYSDWENDDNFFNTFLIPHTKDFISCSKTTLREYNKIKNPIYLLALKRIAEDDYNESKKIIDAKEEKIHAIERGETPLYKKNAGKGQYTPTAKLMRNLEKKSSSSEIFQNAYNFIETDMYNNKIIYSCNKAIDYLITETEKNKDNPIIQNDISRLLSQIITPEKMFNVLLPALWENEAESDDNVNSRSKKLAQTKESRLVLDHFPKRHTITGYENTPEKSLINISFRKTFILFFYLNYIYTSNWFYNAFNPIKKFKDNSHSFEDFFYKLNDLLNKCKLGHLYPHDRFDWLILSSIVQIETYNPDIDDDPLEYLNNIIRMLTD
ncbi:MAG: hypothetical protein IJ224_05790 [Lachnospiraceae bacterium]|nr:hypothetical protein [Lachnospiraceae bacterium]